MSRNEHTSPDTVTTEPWKGVKPEMGMEVDHVLTRLRISGGKGEIHESSSD